MMGLKSACATAFTVATALLCTVWGVDCKAQSIVQPAVAQAVDGNGVNLATGKFTLPGLDVSIGSSGSGIARVTQGDSDNFSGVLTVSAIPVGSNFYGIVYINLLNASFGGQTYRFVIGTDVPGVGGSHTLTYNTSPYKEFGASSEQMSCTGTTSTLATDRTGTCTLTLQDGTTAVYDRTKISGPGFGPMSTITRPDGEIDAISYYEVGSAPADAKAVALVTSSLGWALKYEVDANYKIIKVTAINTSVNRCDPVACSYDYTSPSVSLTWDGTNGTIWHGDMTSATSPAIKVVDYTVSGGTTTVKSPSTVTKTISTYPEGDFKSGWVSSVAVGGQTWSYNYAKTAGVTTATVTEPNTTATHSLVVADTGLITSTTDELGRVTTYTYDTNTGQLTKVVAPDGNALTGGFTAYTYDSTKRLIQTDVVPKNGATNGVPNSGAALTTSAAYTACTGSNAKVCMKPVSTTDVNNQVTNYTYDALGNLISVIAPPAEAGGKRLATFNTYALKTPKIQTASGLVNSTPVSRLISTKTCEVVSATSTTCDSTSVPTKNLWTATAILYDVDTGYIGPDMNVLPVTTTMSRGDITATLRSDVLYNNRGQGIYAYGPKASDDSTTDLTPKESYAFYDGLGRAVGTIGADPDGSASAMFRTASRTTYNSDGQVLALESGTVPTSAYAGANPVAKWAAAFAEWNSTTAGITVLEKTKTDYSPESATLPGLPVRTRHFAAVGVTNSTLEDSVVETSYDVMGRVSCTASRMLDPTTLHALSASVPNACLKTSPAGADGNDRIVKYTYDELGQVVTAQSGVDTPSLRTEVTNLYSTGTTTDPDGIVIPKGMLASVTDAKGNKTATGYDNFDRPVKTWFPSKTVAGSVLTTDYTQLTYSGARLSSMRLRDGQVITYATYDNLGRILNTTGAAVEGFSYDTFGHTLSHDNTTTGGAVGHAVYTYNALGSVLTATNTLGTGTSRQVSYLYNSYNQRTRLTWPDNFFIGYAYYAGGVPWYIKDSGLIYILRDQYDSYGRHNVKKLGNALPYPVNTTFGFDSTHHVVSMNNNLDGAGNTTTWDNTYTFGYTLGEQLKSKTVSNPTYYAQPVPAYTTTTYGINGQNQVTTANAGSYSYDARGNLSGDGAATYTYNVNNLLTQVVAGGSTTTLAYDAENRLARVQKTGSVAHTFLYDGSDLIAEYDDAGTITNRYVHGFGNDEPVVSYYGSGTADTDRHYLISDGQGSIIAVTDNNGVPSGTNNGINSYDAYGLPQSTNVGRFQYTGQTWLPEIGMYYYKARIYAPSLGRFLQPDPIGYGDGMNMYAYVHGDPLNGADSSGLCNDYTGSACLGAYETSNNTDRGRGCDDQTFGCGSRTFASRSAETGYGNSLSLGFSFSAPSYASASASAPSAGIRPGVRFGKPTGRSINSTIALMLAQALAGAEYHKKFAEAVDSFGDAQEKGYNIAFHYTDMAGADGIFFTDRINPDARGRTYFTFAMMGPEEANDRLIMGNDYGKPFNDIRGSWVVIFALEVGYPMSYDPSTSLSEGFYATGPIRNLRGAYFLYIGPNYFPNDTAWGH